MSKFKPVATETLPQSLLVYLNSSNFATHLLTEVLGVHMQVPNPTSRPAGHYVQHYDPSIEVDGQRGIELTLSKISVRDGRYFGGALKAMEVILTDAVKRFVPKGQTVWIFCVISTDVPVPGTNSTLFEMDEELQVAGEFEPNA